jgi:hypothetical protein
VRETAQSESPNLRSVQGIQLPLLAGRVAASTRLTLAIVSGSRCNYFFYDQGVWFTSVKKKRHDLPVVAVIVAAALTTSAVIRTSAPLIRAMETMIV